jgi:hypothetical protein
MWTTVALERYGTIVAPATGDLNERDSTKGSTSCSQLHRGQQREQELDDIASTSTSTAAPGDHHLVMCVLRVPRARDNSKSAAQPRGFHGFLSVKPSVPGVT